LLDLPWAAKGKTKNNANNERFVFQVGPIQDFASREFENEVRQLLQTFSPFVGEQSGTEDYVIEVSSLDAGLIQGLQCHLCCSGS
jgi:hypothetical protein